MLIKLPFISLALLVPLATATTYAGDEWPEYSIEEEVSQLVGLRYLRSIDDSRINPDLSCTYLGGGILGTSATGNSVSTVSLECQGRQVIAIQTNEQVIDERIRWYKIIDALLLPPTKDGSEGPDELVDIASEFCEIDGKDGYPNYKILGRWKDHEVIDGHNGIEHAWLLDYEQTGNIIPVDINRIICYRVEL